MSEQPGPPPEQPGVPDPGLLEALDAMMHSADPGLVPPGVDAVIDGLTALHARWYRAWMAAGLPEKRAAQNMQIMIREAFRAR